MRKQASEEGRKYFEKLHETPSFGTHGFDLDDLRQGMGSRREPTFSGVRLKKVDAAGVPSEWVMADGTDTDIRMLYLHGGGYISGSGAYYLALAARISAAAKCAVLLPDYRLGPEHPFPAGLDDCVSVFEWMRRSGPHHQSEAKSTFISGDSAGGGLTLAALLKLRDEGKPLPAGAIPISPFADLTLAGDSLVTEGDLDPIMHPKCLPDFVNRYLGDADARHPLVSPAFGDYADIPPLLIQVGEHEIIRDDSVTVAAQAEDAGVDVTVEVWPGMFHVFQSHEPLLPEGREAIGHIGEFVKKCMRVA
ncbi:MAG: alpha/beta hydrolase [Planctomycetota bacterium]|jgi:acetyl esterase/lipase|nr:alpha/beta hydrolase [Planctomycetota bacterium]